jgi:Na+/melibiose symporter-like transporter
MNGLRTIGYIAAAILIFFGVLFIWGAFSEQGNPSWLIVGIVVVAIGFGLIFLASRKWGESKEAQNITYKLDLPANVNLDTLKCKSCGGVLTVDNIQMLAGAPVVTCPYCHSSYQLAEEPKW